MSYVNGVARNRKESMAETREALIAAGIGAFSDEGLDASLDEICARAGYTRGAFYVHFADRDDFLVAVMDRVGELFLSAVFAGASLPATTKRFVEAIDSGAYPLTRRGGVRPHQLIEACMRSPAVRARYVALIETSRDRLSGMLRDGQKGELRDDLEPDDVAVLVMATIIGAQTMMDLDTGVDAPKLASTMLKLLTKQGGRRGQ
jgi:TetR/AcrR family transcriptional repressor of nem operon